VVAVDNRSEGVKEPMGPPVEEMAAAVGIKFGLNPTRLSPLVERLKILCQKWSSKIRAVKRPLRDSYKRKVASELARRDAVKSHLKPTPRHMLNERFLGV
jgi:hypothetical protein